MRNFTSDGFTLNRKIQFHIFFPTCRSIHSTIFCLFCEFHVSEFDEARLYVECEMSKCFGHFQSGLMSSSSDKRVQSQNARVFLQLTCFPAPSPRRLTSARAWSLQLPRHSPHARSLMHARWKRLSHKDSTHNQYNACPRLVIDTCFGIDQVST